jgi:TetR/AcrR family transcriptional repressor of nem operon
MTDRSKIVQSRRRGRPPTPGLRDALVTAGLIAMHARGYHATGVAEIVTSARAPKGGFYGQFASKDAFAIAVVDRFADRLITTLREHLRSAEPSPRARLRGYFVARVAHHRTHGCVRGCLLGNFALELSDDHAAIRARVHAHLEAFARELARTIALAQDAGELRRDQPALRLARHVVTAWEGALLAMRAAKRVTPLREFIALTIDDFLVG